MRRNRSVRWPSVTLALLLAWTLAGPALAQEESPAPQEESPAPQEEGAPAPEETPAAPAEPAETTAATAAGWPTVTAARSNNQDHPNRASLGDAVILTVDGLTEYLGTDETKCENLVLFLDEVAIDGSSPESCDPYQETLRFRLDRTEKSDEAWHVLLAEPVGFVKEVDVSVGPDGRLMFPTKAKDFYLEVLPAVELYGFVALLVIGLIGMIVLARRTALLRDPGLGAGAQGPYSLSRFQLAFWSFLVVGAYLFIWMITEELDTITGSVLVLLGIGSGTALGAALIDQGKPPAATPPPASEASGDAAVAPKPATASQGFLRDVLSDENGISLYRFQLFTWTLVLGIIFCASVYNGLAMPQFSTTLLGLMGISSGTYLGFKVPEGAAKE